MWARSENDKGGDGHFVFVYLLCICFVLVFIVQVKQATCKCGLEVRMTSEAMVIARKKINKSSRSITRATWIDYEFVFVFSIFL